MRKNESIENKVFFIFGTFTLVLALIYSAFSIMVAYVVEDKVLENILAQEASYIERAYHHNREIVQPRMDYMTLYLSRESLPKEIADSFKDNSNSAEIFTQSRKHYHVRVLYFSEHNSPILIAEVSSLLIVTNISKRILILFILIFVMALIVSIWLAYRIAKKTTKPLLILTKEVMEQKSQAAPAEFSSRYSKDEIGYLANTIEETLNQLKHLNKREIDFTRDVSHELRTPLTVIKNTLALVEMRAWTQEDGEQLKHSVSRMEMIVATLLALAREESIKIETFNIRLLLEESILAVEHKLSENKFKINLICPNQFFVIGNENLFLLLVGNLIENAIYHAEEQELTIELSNNRLVFSNPYTRDFSNQNITDITNQKIKKTSSKGIGQGLFLVKRIVESISWDFDISLSNGYFKFIVIPNGIKKKD